MSDSSESGEEIAKGQKTRRVLIIVVSLLGAALLVLGGVLYWQSYLGPQRAAESALSNLSANRGNITAVNTDLVTYEGQKLETANTDQKGLGKGNELTNPPAFIFANGKDNSDRKILDFYFDFSDQRSRDALIFNSQTLKSLVESGQIELRLHPLFGGRAYSVYAAEAVAEVFATEPNLAWDTLLVLLRNAPALTSVDDNGALVDGVVKAIQDTGVRSVNSESIKNGTFAAWLLSIGNDPKLSGAVAPKLPYILIGERPLSLDANELNDQAAFKKALIRGVEG